MTKKLNRKILEEINNDKKDVVSDIFTALLLISVLFLLALAVAPKIGIGL